MRETRSSGTKIVPAVLVPRFDQVGTGFDETEIMVVNRSVAPVPVQFVDENSVTPDGFRKLPGIRETAVNIGEKRLHAASTIATMGR